MRTRCAAARPAPRRKLAHSPAESARRSCRRRSAGQRTAERARCPAVCSLTTCPPDCPALHVRGRTAVPDGAAPRSAQRPVNGLRSVHSRSLMPACGVILAHPRAPRRRTARGDARSGTTATLRHFLLDTRASRPRLQHARAYLTACTLCSPASSAESVRTQVQEACTMRRCQPDKNKCALVHCASLSRPVAAAPSAPRFRGAASARATR